MSGPLSLQPPRQLLLFLDPDLADAKQTEGLATALGSAFPTAALSAVHTGPSVRPPQQPPYYDPQRGQYRAPDLLKWLESPATLTQLPAVLPEQQGFVKLLIVQGGGYSPGQEEDPTLCHGAYRHDGAGGAAAVFVSGHLAHDADWLAKEAIAQVGHALGLGRCSRPCVMQPVCTERGAHRKLDQLCEKCWAQLLGKK